MYFYFRFFHAGLLFVMEYFYIAVLGLNISPTTGKTCVIVYNKIVLINHSSSVVVLCICGAVLIDWCD